MTGEMASDGGETTPPDTNGLAARPRPGRPPVLAEAERRRLLFDAAAGVFVAKFYAATTMDAIAAAAGMSKKTLYKMFPSKLAMFDALLRDRVFDLPVEIDVRACSQEEGLTRLLLAIYDVLLRPDRIGLIRLIVADGAAFPELMGAFERLRMAPNLNLLAVWLEREQAAGRLRAGDVQELADLVFAMTVAGPILKSLVSAPATDGAPSVEQRIGMAARIFLRGLAVEA